MVGKLIVVSATGSRSIRGFALPVVIITLAAIGAIAVGIIPKGTAGIVDAASFERRARERLLLDAGIARGILALVTLDDPMTEALRQHGSAAWAFAGRDLSISVSSESAKLDLNAADPGALAGALNRVLGPDLGPEALNIALAKRGQLTTPDQILPFAQRFTPISSRLRNVVTVYGGQVEERSIETTSADGMPTTPTSERPIYTVRAWLAGSARSRAVTVLVDPEAHRYVVVDRADLDIDKTSPDQ